MEITRDIFNNLKAWKDSKRRKPLVMQGSRQVGKSWALRKFGEACLVKLAYFNLNLPSNGFALLESCRG